MKQINIASLKIFKHNSQIRGAFLKERRSSSSIRWYLNELVDAVKVVVGPSSLLGNQTLLKAGEATVHIVLQIRLQFKRDKHRNSNQNSLRPAHTSGNITHLVQIRRWKHSQN